MRACAFFRRALCARGRRRGNATMTTGMTSAAPPRVLVVAHRTAATPRLLDEVRSRARRPLAASRCWSASLLGPGHRRGRDHARAGHPAARRGGGWEGRRDRRRQRPFVAVQQAVERGDFDELIISTLRRASRAGCGATSPTAWRRSACPSLWSPPSSWSPPRLEFGPRSGSVAGGPRSRSPGAIAAASDEAKASVASVSASGRDISIELTTHQAMPCAP